MMTGIHLRKQATPKQTLLALAIIGTALLLGAGLLFCRQYQKNDNNALIPTVTPGSITIEGEIVCLPKPGNGPHTLECAFGLKSDDGKHFGLKGLDQDALIDGTITTGTRVRVSGSVTQPADDEIYAVAGNIQITTIEVISSAVHQFILQPGLTIIYTDITKGGLG